MVRRTDVREAAAPFGRPLFLNINSVDASVSYGVTDRVDLTLMLPFSYGTQSRFHADLNRHTTQASGLGDVSVVSNMWLRNPACHPNGNVSVGFGLKTPSGNNDALDYFFQPNGSDVRGPVDQSIQLGDGGVGIILQRQAFQNFSNRASGYFYGGTC